MNAKINIRKPVKLFIAFGVMFFFIGYSETQQETQVVHDIVIRIENVHDNHFIDEQDIVRLMQLDHENLKGAPFNRINLKEIETRIKSDRHVQEAELYSDIKGNLVVKATLRRPVARLVRDNGPDAYIAEDGTIMPVSEKFTARVVVVSGSFVRTLMLSQNVFDHEDGKSLMELLMQLREDRFWNAQIAQVDVDARGRIVFIPQIGNQTVDFGHAVNTDEKLKKLKILYKEILPQMGWNKYSRISLEYEGQIVAE